MSRRARGEEIGGRDTEGGPDPGRPGGRGPRLFPSRWSRRERLVYGGAVVWFLAIFTGLVWPVYPAFSGIRPIIFGLPLSLAYVVALLILSFAGTLALYLWEGRRGEP